MVVVRGGYLVAMVRRFRDRTDDFAWALLTGLAAAAFFFGLMLGPANPFRLVDGQVPLDGRGPNPLPQNHPLGLRPAVGTPARRHRHRCRHGHAHPGSKRR